MFWLARRQFRSAIGTLTVIVVAICLVLSISGLNAATLAAKINESLCAKQPDSCSDSLADLRSQFRVVAPVLAWIALLPLVAAAVWGGALVARELESGTARLAWNQSVSRRHWLAIQMLVACATLAAAALILGLAMTWWLAMFDPLAAPGSTIYAEFTLHGPLLAGLTTVVFAGGVSIGMWTKRTIPAIAGSVAFMVILQSVRVGFTGEVPMAATAGEFFGRQAVECSILLTLAMVILTAAYYGVDRLRI